MKNILNINELSPEILIFTKAILSACVLLECEQEFLVHLLASRTTSLGFGLVNFFNKKFERKLE